MKLKLNKGEIFINNIVIWKVTINGSGKENLILLDKKVINKCVKDFQDYETRKIKYYKKKYMCDVKLDVGITYRDDKREVLINKVGEDFVNTGDSEKNLAGKYNISQKTVKDYIEFYLYRHNMGVR